MLIYQICKCVEGYERDSTGVCKLKCKPNEIIIAGKCSACPPDTQYDFATQSCKANCNPGCTACTATACTACALQGFYPLGMNCVEKCGDGNQTATEQCDDGNTAENDGCSSTCKTDPNYYCVGKTPTKCEIIITNCGALNNCAKCTASQSVCLACTNLGEYPRGIRCEPRCGDGNQTTTELCDDGNRFNNDGCNSDCKV